MSQNCFLISTLITSFLCYQLLGDMDPNHPLTRPTTPGTRGADAAAQGYIFAALWLEGMFKWTVITV